MMNDGWDADGMLMIEFERFCSEHSRDVWLVRWTRNAVDFGAWTIQFTSVILNK